jgi:hypothetical protein
MRRYRAAQPPATGTVSPVTPLAPSEHSHRKASARSSGYIRRAIGWVRSFQIGANGVADDRAAVFCDLHRVEHPVMAKGDCQLAVKVGPAD